MGVYVFMSMVQRTGANPEARLLQRLHIAPWKEMEQYGLEVISDMKNEFRNPK